MIAAVVAAGGASLVGISGAVGYWLGSLRKRPQQSLVEQFDVELDAVVSGGGLFGDGTGALPDVQTIVMRKQRLHDLLRATASEADRLR